VPALSKRFCAGRIRNLPLLKDGALRRPAASVRRPGYLLARGSWALPSRLTTGLPFSQCTDSRACPHHYQWAMNPQAKPSSKKAWQRVGGSRTGRISPASCVVWRRSRRRKGTSSGRGGCRVRPLRGRGSRHARTSHLRDPLCRRATYLPHPTGARGGVFGCPRAFQPPDC
jgi:hypothetical protein